MKKKRFGCRRCQKTFEVDVYEPGEAEEKGKRGYPIRCPKCGGPVEPC